MPPWCFTPTSKAPTSLSATSLTGMYDGVSLSPLAPLFGRSTFGLPHVLCEGRHDGDNDIGSESDKIQPPINSHQGEIERLQKELDKPCVACMYTGMAVCSGLSLYFINLATENAVTPSNKRFFFACSAGCALAGAYRWYLG